MQVICWGTYDTGKPRTRILLRGLRENGIEVIEVHTDVWSGVEDKSRIAGSRRLRFLLRWLFAYPALVARYLRAPRHDAVVVGYLGQLDVLVLWLFARCRGVPIVWDAFLSLHDTVVEDRRMVSARHPVAWLLFALEWLACRAANRIVLDTQAHADYFAAKFRVAPERFTVAFVGVEPEAFPPCRRGDSQRAPNVPFTVLFYGQFIALHGIETIVEAAQMTAQEKIDWVLIGCGQEEDRIRTLIDTGPAVRLRWIPWVQYATLHDWIHRADLCLGIFGDSGKAGRVIPNKVFQILASGAPLVTRDSPAIRELLSPDAEGIWLVPPADPAALAEAARECRQLIENGHRPVIPASMRGPLRPVAVTRELCEVLFSHSRPKAPLPASRHST
jgi:glycosyltransferase involved in cell wall biosynthesis